MGSTGHGRIRTPGTVDADRSPTSAARGSESRRDGAKKIPEPLARLSEGKVTDRDGPDPENGPAEGAGPWEAFGQYLKSQRQLARLSLRQLADLTRVSNPYLSQIERGLHQPSVTIIKTLAEALGVSPEDLLAHAAGINVPNSEPSTEAAIRADPKLNEAQKGALLAVYRSMVEDTRAPATKPRRSA
jgi:transcriptional regulator with XRE-family HTH domain